MKAYATIASTVLAAAVLAFGSRPAVAAPWVTAYLPGWEVSQNGVDPARIDFKSITHLVWFSLTPTSSGSIVEPASNPGVNSGADAVASAVHKAGKKALICIGGQGSERAFAAAFQGHTSALVHNIVAWVKAHDFDGVDIDDEPLAPSDKAKYQAFITMLRSVLGDDLTLTAAVEPFSAAPGTFTDIAGEFDQINIMTYDMIYGNQLSNGSGEMTWFNAPISARTAGETTTVNYEQTGSQMPSIEMSLWKYTSSPVSIPVRKLGIGTAFYGYVFPNATSYGQVYHGAFPPDTVSYDQIMTNAQYFDADYYHYDAVAGTSYIGRRDTANFITFDDPNSVAAKVQFVESSGLGGMICFEIGQQYHTGQPLLHAIDVALGK